MSMTLGLSYKPINLNLKVPSFGLRGTDSGVTQPYGVSATEMVGKNFLNSLEKSLFENFRIQSFFEEESDNISLDWWDLEQSLYTITFWNTGLITFFKCAKGAEPIQNRFDSISRLNSYLKELQFVK